jgi:hypothetical protein
VSKLNKKCVGELFVKVSLKEDEITKLISEFEKRDLEIEKLSKALEWANTHIAHTWSEDWENIKKELGIDIPHS